MNRSSWLLNVNTKGRVSWLGSFLWKHWWVSAGSATLTFVRSERLPISLGSQYTVIFAKRPQYPAGRKNVSFPVCAWAMQVSPNIGIGVSIEFDMIVKHTSIRSGVGALKSDFGERESAIRS